ncbi:hypothetical protein K435DRAFT_40590 [Dendrothele bispora CBS 962.96]|uniref:Nucleolar 27S pre-rRNA processing Urb2/Npa2 C-terminal domain-containing protein n=1 Tax=Dendrothele bispora (strain CBS 962.96) TaxID=1314807 RepID=A0A4S8MSL7_DENBC|nr:hypothetical protein K435DRAFT_40590 [Dendrothele bispora CBS 962.96]
MFQTSQDFVKALKSSSDPPTLDGPTKIEIARTVWDNSSFYVPRKGEVIADWILGSLLKERDRSENTTFLDNRYWSLLRDVINTASASTWLPFLLSRISIAAILIPYLDSLHNANLTQRSQTLELVQTCLAVIWPLSCHRMSAEVLTDCVSSLFNLIKNWSQKLDENIIQIGTVILVSFRRSLATCSVKKKIFSTFVRSSLTNWITCCATISSVSVHDISQVIYQSGIDCLFNLEILRDSKLEDMLLGALGQVEPGTVVDFLPRLYSSHIESIKKNRGVLFAQDSRNRPDPLEEYHSTALRIFQSYHVMLYNDKLSNSAFRVWHARVALLSLVDEQHLFSGQQDGNVFKQIVQTILLELTSSQTESTQIVFKCLVTLLRIDYRLIEDDLPAIISRLLFVPHHVSSALAFLELLVQYHTKTRTLDTYIERLLSVCSGMESHSSDLESLIQDMSSNALLHPTHLDSLAKGTHDFLPAAQTSTVVHSSIATLEDLQVKFLDVTGSETPPKKRKLHSGKKQPSQDLQLQAMRVYTTSRLVEVVLSAFSLQSVTEETRDQILLMLDKFESSFLTPALLQSLKLLGIESTWAEESILASLLRLRYAVCLQHSKSVGSALNTEQNFVNILRQRLESKTVDMCSDFGLEMLRTYLSTLTDDAPSLLFDQMLGSLETNLSQNGAFMLLHMLIHRWLPAFDLRASESQLQKFISIFLDVLVRKNSPYPLQTLLSQLVCMADFWELSRIRFALLISVDGVTAALDNVGRQSSSEISPQEMHGVVSVFDLLLVTPVEFLPRSLKVTLVKRARVFDSLMASISSRNLWDLDTPASLCIIRRFTCRVLQSLDLADPLVCSYDCYRCS